jgi:hypothetical protein
MAEVAGAGWAVRSGGGRGKDEVFRPYQYELMLHRGGKAAADKPSQENRSGKRAPSNTGESKTDNQTPKGESTGSRNFGSCIALGLTGTGARPAPY